MIIGSKNISATIIAFLPTAQYHLHIYTFPSFRNHVDGIVTTRGMLAI